MSMAGRPRHYETPEDLEAAIDDYLQHTAPVNYTITGLALALGFCDRQSLYDYEEKTEFSCIIKKARLYVENAYETKLCSNNVTGAIFALKNMGWKDKSEVDNNVTMGINWNEVKTYDPIKEADGGN